MRRWIDGVLLAVLAAGLFGCSASGPRYSEMAGSLPSLGDNEGRIYFYRNSIMGAALQPEVSVNGQAVGKSRPNSFFYIDRPAGSYRASARTESEGTVDIVLRPKQTAYVLMSMNFGLVVGRPSFDRVSETEGRKEIQSLAYDDSYAAARTVSASATAASTGPASSAADAAMSKPVMQATPVAAAALAPVTAAAPPSAAAPPTATPKPQPPRGAAPPEVTPFAKASLNDLRQLLQVNR